MGSRVPTTVDEIDSALTECSKRLKLARESGNWEARLVYSAQADRLLSWRWQATHREKAAAR